MSNILSFLDKITVAEVATKAPSVASKNNLPPAEFVGIRVFKNGKIFPSQSLVSTFNLEYPNAKMTKTFIKDEAGNIIKDDKGNDKFTLSSDPFPGTFGLDIIDTSKWSDLKLPEGAPRALLVGISPREASRVDIFKKTVYNEDGTPKNSVLDQGSDAYGKETLLPLLKEVYGIELEEAGFVDLKFNTEFDFKTLVPNGLALIPKPVLKGADKGQMDTVRRENISIFVIEPVATSVSAAAIADSTTTSTPPATEEIVVPTPTV